jgi:hypothetical protein
MVEKRPKRLGSMNSATDLDPMTQLRSDAQHKLQRGTLLRRGLTDQHCVGGCRSYGSGGITFLDPENRIRRSVLNPTLGISLLRQKPRNCVLKKLPKNLKGIPKTVSN